MTYKDSIVFIKAKKNIKNNPEFDSSGTGFIFHVDQNDTYILTCYHVVADRGTQRIFDEIEVNIRNGSTKDATVIKKYSNYIYDLAVLKISQYTDKKALNLNLSYQNKYRIPPESPFYSFGAVVDNGQLGNGETFSEIEGFFQKNTREISSYIQTIDRNTPIDVYKVKCDNNFFIRSGRSGSPVFNKEKNCVLGILGYEDRSHTQQNENQLSNQGWVIPIEVLNILWGDDLPDKFKISLSSTKEGVDFVNLRNYLAQGEWKKANNETIDLMMTLAMPSTKEKNGKYLDEEQISTFPLEDLHTIDKLWRNYSDDRFGLSIQNESYVQKTFNLEDKYEMWDHLVRSVRWDYKEYDEIDFSLNAPKGHLPHLGIRLDKNGTQNGDVEEFIGGLRWHYLSLLLTKLELENIKKTKRENENLEKEIADLKQKQQDNLRLFHALYQETKRSQEKELQIHNFDKFKNALIQINESSKFESDSCSFTNIRPLYFRRIPRYENEENQEQIAQQLNIHLDAVSAKTKTIQLQTINQIKEVYYTVSYICSYGVSPTNVEINTLENNNNILKFQVRMPQNQKSYIYKITVKWIAFGT